MKLLLFGGSGQLGREIIKRCKDLHFEVAAPVTREVNITDVQQIYYLTKTLRPDVIINSAAYTAVDLAEQEIDKAYGVNHLGVINVAKAAAQVNARVIHLSTDYVFAGNTEKPLKEEDPTNPLSVYGKSKLAGEQALMQELGDKALVVRTSSLHGAYGQNFVHTMLKLFAEKSEVKIVAEQRMSPTWAGWLAEVLLDLCRIDASGIIHASGSGSVSWHRFASLIYNHALPHNKKINPNLKITPISLEELNRPAKRPVYSVFNCDKLSALIGRQPMNYEEGLLQHLKEIDFGCKL